MKKVLFSSAAALCAAVGLSSFTQKPAEDLRVTYYFKINTGLSGQTAFNNADVTYLGTTAGTDSPCPGVGKRCVVSFSASQISVVGGITKLKTGANPAQTRVATIFTRLAL